MIITTGKKNRGLWIVYYSFGINSNFARLLMS
jgi:hypothetical protein